MSIETYTATINPATRVVTVSGLSDIDPTRVKSVHNVTRNRRLYSQSTRVSLTASGSTLTLPQGSVYLGDSSSDVIEVRYGRVPTGNDTPSGTRSVYQINNEFVSFEVVE